MAMGNVARATQRGEEAVDGRGGRHDRAHRHASCAPGAARDVHVEGAPCVREVVRSDKRRSTRVSEYLASLGHAAIPALTRRSCARSRTSSRGTRRTRIASCRCSGRRCSSAPSRSGRSRATSTRSSRPTCSARQGPDRRRAREAQARCADRILSNKLYQYVSTSLAGTQEYMAWRSASRSRATLATKSSFLPPRPRTRSTSWTRRSASWRRSIRRP